MTITDERNDVTDTRRSRAKQRPRWVAPAALAAVVGIGAGGAYVATRPDDTTNSPIVSGQKENLPQGTVDTVPAMGREAVSVRQDVHLTKCTLVKGKVVAEGTIKNTAKDDRDLLIAAQWLPKLSGDTIGLGVWTKKSVGAGETVEFTTDATLPIAADRCLVLAQSAPAGTLK